MTSMTTSNHEVPMIRCGHHSPGLIDSEEHAVVAARRVLSFIDGPLFGEYMTDLSNPESVCCPAVGYARYLMANAMRQELREGL